MSTWCDDEVKALISIWGDSKVQSELDGAVRNKQIYTNIAKKMKELGHDRDWQQCKTKVKNLKSDYRKIKDHNGETGRERKTCRFYSELDEILGERPASVPAHVIDTSTSASTSSSSPRENINDDSDVVLPAPVDSSSLEADSKETEEKNEDGPPKKKAKVSKQTKGEKAMERALSTFQKHQQEAEERWQKQEEERWKKECEREDRQRKEDKEHDKELFRMLGEMLRPQPTTDYYPFTHTYDHN